jgi:hypothetical protein
VLGPSLGIHLTQPVQAPGCVPNPDPVRGLPDGQRLVGSRPPSSSMTTTSSRPGFLRDQIELLALVRDTGVTTAQLRTLLQLSPQALQAVTDLIEHTTRKEQG